MNGTNENITKKVLPLAAVLILCAASLVTVAYAYNASYQDTIDEQYVPVDETSKYIYITGDGLGYPAAEKFEAITSVQYDTVSNANGITATPKSFEITDLKSTDETRAVSYADGIATIKIGDVTVNNKNTALKNVYVSVAGIEVTDLSEGKANLFKDALTSSNIFMKVAGAEGYSNVFKLTQEQAVIEVYIVAEINTNPDVLGVSPEPVKINEQGELASTVKSILYAPGFTLSLAATAGDNLTIASGTVTANDIAEFKTSAASNANFSAKVINDDGASITMDRTAIGLLGSADAELEVVASDMTGYAKAYEIDFGDNHFGNGTLTITIPYDGEVTENMMVAYLNNGAVDEVYEATYADGFITFTTNHLSTFAVGTSDLANNMAVKLEKDGMTSYYNNVGDAIITGRMGTSVITLLNNVTEDRIFGVRDVTDLTINLNGKTLTATNWSLFSVTDQSAKITFDGTVEGSKVVNEGGYVVFNNTTTQDLQKFDLVVNGGTYVAEHGFILYNANTVTINDAKFDVTASSVWFGNIGAKKVTISNIEVESDSTGIYLGSVKDATVRNAKVTAAGTALEIKSGNVKILGGEFTGGKYSIDDTIVNHNGTGGAEAVVVVNNGYCVKIPGCDSVNVTMDNVTLKYSDATIEGKPMVVYSDVDVDKDGEDAGKDKDITVVWKDNSDKIVTFYNGTSPDITINGTVVEKPKTN